MRQFRPKGTIVKSVHGTYYVYEATSKSVEGKKYPVHVIKGVIGKIDERGFHKMTKAVVDTTCVRVRECGFTNYMLMFEDFFVGISTHGGKKLRQSLYRSLIVYLSPNSYLTEEKGVKIYSLDYFVEKLGIGIPNQITVIRNMLEIDDLEELEPLKYICAVFMGDRIFDSELNDKQKEIIRKLGMEEKDVRFKRKSAC